MPIYEYECEACGHRTEALQRVDEDPLTECPHCEGRLRKLISAPAFQFKGSGWYVTDYAGKGSGGEKGEKGEKSDKGSEKGSGETTGGGTEAAGKTSAGAKAASGGKGTAD